MLITFGVIALAIAMILGPIMMLQPTQGLARIARLRTLASQHGLSVQLLPKSESPNKVELAKYNLAWKDPQRRNAETDGWSLMFRSMAHDIHFDGNWDWGGKGRVSEQYSVELKNFLKTLPEGFKGVVANGGGIGIVWDEKCKGETEENAIADVKSRLEHLREILEP